MENHYNKVRDYYFNLTGERFYNPYINFREKRLQFIGQLKSETSEFTSGLDTESDKVELYRQISRFTRKIQNLINEELILCFSDIEELLNIIEIKSSEQLFSELPQQIIFEQEESHFSGESGDSVPVKLFKVVKKGILPVYRLIYKQRRYWNREVPFADIARYYFEFSLYADYYRTLYDLVKLDIKHYTGFLESFRLLERDISENFSNANSIISDVKGIEKYLGEVEQNFPPLIEEDSFYQIFITIATKFRYALDNCGTLSEPSGKFNRVSSERNYRAVVKTKNEQLEGLKGYLKVLTEKLVLTVDVFTSCLDMGAEVLEDIKKHVFQIKDVEIRGLTRIAAEINEKTSSYSNDMDLKLFLETLKDDYKNILTDEEAVTLIEKIPYSGIKLFADRYAGYLRNGIDSLRDKYRLVNLDDVNFTTSPEKFNEFDPKDIITTLYFKDSINLAETYRDNIVEKYQHAVKNLIDCPDIVEFNIDTAIDVLETSPTRQAEAKKIAFEGINRVIAKLEEASAILTIVNDDYAAQLEEEAYKFIEEFRSVLNVKKVTAVILQLSKERTVEHLKQSFRDFWGKVKRFLPVLARKIRQIATGTKHIYGEISRKVGLTDSAGEISAEISDYLLEVESNVSKLPKVYQRLFRYEPLNDERFLVGREVELHLLESAFNRWKHGHHASLALIGEKGAGISTLLNFAENKFLPKKKIFRRELKETIFSEELLIKFLAEFLDLKGVKDEHDLLHRLKVKLKGSTIILENGEDLFLRTTAGFEAISSLLRYITLTSDDVFWIITFNKYSWNYLSQTLNIADYFTNFVEMGSGNERQIEDIIMKRHSVSGYKIVFEPGKQPKQGFNKLSEDEIQKELKKAYFETLTLICEGNVALALVFWLRSVSKFDQEVIYIADLNDLDFSFVKKLSDNKHFNLAAILLHDGITLDEYQLIFNTNYKEAQLQLLSLLDDGILFERKGRYKINFLLYRQIVNSLKTKNMLH